MAKIVWSDIWGKKSEKQVDDDGAEEEAERIRTLPDVKADDEE